ncbi:MAG: hypothetical protein OER88_12985 [Planctomycetota bacterium]|nr:hypothetical protein [Planctomycetota bacterium]
MNRPRRRERRLGLVWSVLRYHYESRRAVHEVFREYESRVARLVKERGVPRGEIRLNAAETQDLFDTWRLKALFERQLTPLHHAAGELFPSGEKVELYASIVSRIFHEVAILVEEHMSVRAFPRAGAARQFARLFREVSEYYPQRLRRMKDLFARAQKRLDTMLPGFSEDTIVLRSCYLFAEDLWPEGARAGLVRFFDKMFPDGGAAEGLLRVARSFFKAGFFDESAECSRMGVAALSKQAQARTSHAQRVRETIRELDRLAAKADAEAKALQEGSA